MAIAYVALDERGQQVTGQVEAADPLAAAAQLRGQGLFPIELGPAAAGRGGAARRSPRAGLAAALPLRAADVALFHRQLAMMLRSGLSLLDSLEQLREYASRRRLRAAAGRLSEAVQRGSSLSDALAAEGGPLGGLVVHLVRTAEATGELELAFDRAADSVERAAELRSQVTSALLYPAVVVAVAVGVFWFLALEVVPKFASYLARRGSALPPTTQLLIDVSDLLREHGLAVAGGGAVVGALLLAFVRTRAGRRLLDRVSLKVPVIGAALQAAAMAHFTRTVSMLLRSGHTLLDAVGTAADTSANTRVAEALRQARDQVVRGEGLSRALDRPPFPVLCARVVGIGEQAGTLDQVLDELSAFYDRRLQRTLRVLASLVEPAVLLVVGGLVGFVYMSFFQAVFRLTGG